MQLHTFFLPHVLGLIWQEKKGNGKASRQAVLVNLELLSTSKKHFSLGVLAPDIEAWEEA